MTTKAYDEVLTTKAYGKVKKKKATTDSFKRDLGKQIIKKENTNKTVSTKQLSEFLKLNVLKYYVNTICSDLHLILTCISSNGKE